ncbi:glutamine synthetase [Ruminococcus sp. YE71]|uniref:glutamine synthetase III family protein n=1 Tax=unclassified Ruminococcus TaxID=2608920 RepID=UPI00088E3E98|nr:MULTISPECIES: glutamine synthetase III [unclassified Ruminococcus]SDA10217.1 glutamine synthetase [Ruminococcus sp. YE78]SFW10988.1 glutamine synthetase [Ruminococcus sp. YE71]
MNIPEIFGTDVFNETVMQQRLPKSVYKALKKTIESGKPLDIEVANVVAAAMKEWAVEKGCTHYTHWFQPMTGITAEKHDSFITPVGDGKVIMEFSGKELVKGEPDASSFPSGGLRATFEARGYTAWDPTSYAFIKGTSLCIPTAFCSYTGEALDKKTPLLRSMEALDKSSVRLLKLFGMDDVTRVTANVGPEQEYFLVDREMYSHRKDLILAGRTLFGAPAPKGQELEDHYFGTIKTRVNGYMADLDEQLWRLGICAKTKHNEVAPAQHELAPIYNTTNIATDHNQLTMELMKRTARKHGFKCLLHEKPFEGVNGSGKHNNWSVSTDTGVNLLDPGKTPAENAVFLTYLVAVIKAVNDYQDLLRASVATAGNDHRLGANEAPPAIISIFLGDELNEIIEALAEGHKPEKHGKTTMEIGVDVLPSFPKDTTDRNRTSPFAFTGNKFEFRSPGSRLSCAGPMTIMNTIVAEVLDQFYEKLKDASDFRSTLDALIKETIVENKRIIFNGNGYSDEWVAEAEKRGLLNLRSTPDAIPVYLLDKNVEVLSKHGVYSKVELESRVEILLDEYCKTINIEAKTMIDMAKKDILPAVMSYVKDLSDTAATAGALGADLTVEKELVTKLSAYAAQTYKALGELEEAEEKVAKLTDTEETAKFFHEVVLEKMAALRKPADEMEALCGEKYWPYPTYEQLLFYVK